MHVKSLTSNPPTEGRTRPLELRDEITEPDIGDLGELRRDLEGEVVISKPLKSKEK